MIVRNGCSNLQAMTTVPKDETLTVSVLDGDRGLTSSHRTHRRPCLKSIAGGFFFEAEENRYLRPLCGGAFFGSVLKDRHLLSPTT